MKALIIGSGGREHALAWKVVKSDLVEKVFVAPGNAGTALEPGVENIDIGVSDIDALVNFAEKERIELTIVGPEALLTDGLVDRFAEKVYLLIRGDFSADQILIDRVERMEKVEILKGYVALEIFGRDQVEGLRIKNLSDDSESRLDISGIFVEVGQLPNTGFIMDALDVNDAGEILINCQTETGAPGVFAAGDVTNVRDKYIVVAAGEGAKAALRAHEYIMSKR